MKFYLFVVLAAMGINTCAAQEIYDRSLGVTLPGDKHYFVIPPDSAWFDMPWKDSVYSLPQFGEAKIELKNGYQPTHSLMMNYNIFFEMFMVRQADGGVIPFTYPGAIKYVWIDNHKFIYTKNFGYMEVILEGEASVAESNFMNAIVSQIAVARGPELRPDNRVGFAKTNRYYYKQTKYYIFSNPSKMHHASPAVLPKIFKGQKDKIREYERSHKTNYRKKEDILDIVSYFNSELTAAK